MEKKDTLSSCSDSEKQQMQLIQDKSKESCMVSFQQLHSHLKCLSNNDFKGSRTEEGFKRAFATLFGQDLETFTGTMFLYMDQLQKQLDNEDFQEIGSMSAFKVLQTQFHMFIKSRFYLDDEYVDMTRNKFLQYTRLDIPEFRDTLIQHMESVKKSIGERAQHKMEYESRVNKRQIQTKEEKTDTSNALDALDANIRPVYDEEPMAEVQMTANDNVSATGQQHTEQPEFNNEGEVDQNAEQCHDIRPLPAKLTDNMTTELSNQLLESENVCLKKSVAQYHNGLDLAPQRQEMSVENVSSGLVPQGPKASDYDNSDPVPQDKMLFLTAEKTDSDTTRVRISFSPYLTNIYIQQHGPRPRAEVKPTKIKHRMHHFKKLNLNNRFVPRVQEIGESLPHAIMIRNRDVHSFQPQNHDNDGPRDHLLEQVCGNPSMPVHTNTLATDPAMTKSQGIIVDKPFGKMIIKTKEVYGRTRRIRQTVIRNKHDWLLKGYARKRVLIFEESFASVCSLEQFGFSLPTQHTRLFHLSNGHKRPFLMGHEGRDALILEKPLLEGYSTFGDKLCKLDSRKQNCTQCLQQRQSNEALSAYCAPKLNTNLADMYTKALPEDRFIVSCQKDWYEMFDSSGTGGSGK
ncbi:hypothetical protein Tco_0054361 [Tanacetum coccineum]